MSNSKIEWTENTWNPVTGCTKISKGCKHCYAERMAKRLQAMRQPNYINGFNLACQEHVLNTPYTWKKPRMIFVNSMSDTFHKDVPFEFIQKIFKVMNETPHHTFQLLTKRADVMLSCADKLCWTDNIWMGVTVESNDYVERIDCLRQMPSAVRFLSLEPLISSVPDLSLQKIDWVIVGGESGPGARPMKQEWVEQIKNQCDIDNVPFFFKQWGGVNKKKAGRFLNNRTFDEMPALV
jgi:protein gp37